MSAHERINHLLLRQAIHHRALTFLDALLLATCFLIASAGLGLGLSSLTPLSGVAFYGFSVLCWGVLAYMIVFSLFRLLRPVRVESTALALETRFPALGSELISAVQLGGSRARAVGELGLSGELIDALAARVAKRLETDGGPTLVDRRPVARSLALVLLLGLTGLAVDHLSGGGFRDVMTAMAGPLRGVVPGGASIAVMPGDARVPEGDGVEVTAALRGTGGGPVRLETATGDQRGAVASLDMERRAPGFYGHLFNGVVEGFSYRAVQGRIASPWYRVSVIARPRAADLRLEFTYPAYAGIASRLQEGSGHISCLKGTVVSWRARANKPLSEAFLLFGSGERQSLGVSEQGDLEGEFIVTTGGSYQVMLTDQEGVSSDPPDAYGIDLVPDEFPTVDLVAPVGDLEVDATSLVDVIFSARDDFGLAGASIVFRPEGGEEGRQEAADLKGRRTFEGGYSWDLGALGLSPGQRVDYYVEVLDTDSISGPKAGRSAVRSIRVKDSLAVHRELVASEKEIYEEFVDVLGDELEVLDAMQELEDPAAAEPEEFDPALAELRQQQEDATRAFEQAMEKLDSFLEQAAEDSFADPSALYMKVLARQKFNAALGEERAEGDQLRELEASEDTPREDRADELGGMGRRKEKRVADLEQALKLLEEASRYQNMEEALTRQSDMLDLQRELMDRLNKMEGGISPQQAQELAGMLQQVAEMLGEIMKSLTSLAEEMPEEFLNSDALDDLPFDDIMELLRDVAKALAEGDLEKAQRLAEELFNKLNDLMERLRTAANEFQDLTQRAIDEFEQERRDEMRDLVEKQRELLQETEQLQREMAARLRESRKGAVEELRRVTDEVVEDLQKLLEELLEGDGTEPRTERALAGSLPGWNRILNEARAEAARGSEAGVGRSFSRLMDEVRRLKDSLPEQGGSAAKVGSALGTVLEKTEDARRRAVLPAGATEADVSTPQEKAGLDRMAARQGELQARTTVLSEKAAALSKVLPMIPAELSQSLDEAAAFMRESEGQLAGGSPSGAVPAEREALYRLLQAQSAAAQAAGQMARMQSLQQGGAGSQGQAGQLFGLMPGFSMRPDRGTREGGRMGISVRNFKIPGSQEFEVPRVFREEVMESIRAGYPKGYEKAVRQYYRSIVE